jgi:hypothetical protein
MTYVVLNTDDSGANSLRQAILEANANPGNDTITFNSRSVRQPSDHCRRQHYDDALADH